VKTGQILSKLSDLLDLLMFGGLLLFLLVLPFHLVVKKLVPDPLGTYWKEILLGLLVLLWATRSLLARRLLLAYWPLDVAVFAYLGVLLLRFVLDGSSWVGVWGLYVTVMYLPLYWIVAAVLYRRPNRLVPLVASLVGVGALVALGGLLEFVWNVPLWPSDETALRQGFPGVFIYGTNIRRVYFTFDSPTTLANTLAMILPLALSLVLVGRHLAIRVVAGLAAALMAACVIVTFSRGIWVATVLSLAVMATWIILSSRARGDLIRRNWKPLVVIGGALGLIALAWAAVWLAWGPRQDSTYEGVVELSRTAYETTPVTDVAQELWLAEPLLGEHITQTWSLPDPITAEDDRRRVLYQHPPETGTAESIYLVEVPEAGALRFAIALSPEVWSPSKGDGASFHVYVAEVEAPGEGQLVFVRYINPKYNPSDRRWRNFTLDLSPWAGRPVQLSLITDPGESGDWSFDWAGWAEPQVVSVVPGYFDNTQAENAILRHTSSITDWAQDETNRDRLAAWSQGINAWLSSPLWGTGLGSTGVAALRTHPESAYVTESQVLKALVELGPIGLLVLAFLWFQIARVGFRTYHAMGESARRILLVGTLTGLLVAFVEGLVYQNLEVKQVNAYYWTLVAAVAFLAGQVLATRPADDEPTHPPDSATPDRA
jgi:O-antigen ligase